MGKSSKKKKKGFNSKKPFFPSQSFQLTSREKAIIGIVSILLFIAITHNVNSETCAVLIMALISTANS